jgi:hypothetical protein
MTPRKHSARRYRYSGILLGLALAALSAVPARAIEDHYPYSIMTPEPGTVSHHRAVARQSASRHRTSRGRERLMARSHRHVRSASRGSSGSVLPTPLPRTPLIPPPSAHIPTPHRGYASSPGPTILPNGSTVPNLPHSTPETFQDRASRCAHQQGLFGVPGSEASTYMHTCAM